MRDDHDLKRLTNSTPAFSLRFDEPPHSVRSVCGFHSPLEQQVLCSLLRRQGRAVKILARGLPLHRPAAYEQDALAAGRLLILTAYPTAIKRMTRESALARNRLVLALSAECVIPQAAPGSPLAALLEECRPPARGR